MPGLPLLVEVAMAYPGRDANIYFFFIMCSGICNTEILLVASSLLFFPSSKYSSLTYSDAACTL